MFNGDLPTLRLLRLTRALGTLALLLAILGGGTPSFSQSRMATITLVDSTTLQAEILVVRDSMLVLSPNYRAPEKWLRSNTTMLTVLPESRILKVTLAGHTNVAAGAGVGAFVGALAGGKIGSNGLEGGEKYLGALGGGFLGCLVGGFLGIGVGGNISSGAEEVSPHDPGCWEKLRSVARYQEEEPEFLRPITQTP